MGLLFDFSRLLQRYSVVCQLFRGGSGGQYIGGNWVPNAAPEPETIAGVLLPMSERKLYQSGGAYTEQDREWITLQKIPLEPAAYLVYEGAKYHVESENDYSQYAGFHDYHLKRVGAFDRTDKH